MRSEQNNPDVEEQEFLKLLRVERPESFWIRQRLQILTAIDTPPPRRLFSRPWVLVPLFGAALVMAVAWKHLAETPPKIPPAQEWAFYEHLDLLEQWDALAKEGRRS